MIPWVARLFLHWVAIRGEELRSLDFMRYYATALIGRRYGWNHLYDAHSQQMVAQHLGVPAFLPNVYTPLMSLLIAPFTVMSPEAAYPLWSALLVLSVVVCCWVSVEADLLVRLVLVLMLFVPYAVQLGLLQGQVVPLQMACVVVSCRLLKAGNESAAGLLLGAVALKPQGMQLIPFVLLAAGHRRAFAAWAAVAALLAGGTAMLIGISGVESYFGRLAWAQAHPVQMMVAWDYTLARRFDSTALRTSVLLLAAGLTLWAARQHRARVEVIYSVGIVGSLLASPYLHLYDFMWLFPAGWLLVAAFPSLKTIVPLLGAYLFVLFSAPASHAARWVLLCECAWVVVLATIPTQQTRSGTARVR